MRGGTNAFDQSGAMVSKDNTIAVTNGSPAIIATATATKKGKHLIIIRNQFKPTASGFAYLGLGINNSNPNSQSWIQSANLVANQFNQMIASWVSNLNVGDNVTIATFLSSSTVDVYGTVMLVYLGGGVN